MEFHSAFSYDITKSIIFFDEKDAHVLLVKKREFTSVIPDVNCVGLISFNQ